MTNLKKKIGGLGEKISKKFLEKQGYEIVDKNFYSRKGEIDLIAKQEDELVFVEVKTRTNRILGYPEEAVTSFKKERMLKTARIYLSENKFFSIRNYRFDVISLEIDLSKKRAKIFHFRNILS